MEGFLGSGDSDDAQQGGDLCPSLSWKQRIIGFVCCLCIGGVLAFISWYEIFQGDYTAFGILFTFSNVCAIGGSLFLAGPVKQFKKMFEETRWIATGLYLLMMIMTLVAAFAIKSPALVIVCAILQYLAMIWYGLSYIPYARTMIKNCIKGIFA